MQLPLELHDAVLRHLDRQDVASYRLVCRRFANFGASHLFERLHFRTSLQSLQRLANISEGKYSHYVKHLLWNTTGSEFEAKPLLEGLRMRELKYVLGEATSGPIANLETSPKPEDQVKEGFNNSLGIFILSTIFSRLPSLKGVYLITSSTRTNAFALDADGWTQRDSRHPTASHDTWPKEWKETTGCSRCEGYCQAARSTLRYEMQVALLAAHIAGRPLRHLRVSNLSFWSSKSEGLMKGYEMALSQITNLQLVLKGPNRALDEVQAIFRATPRLKVLKLWLHSSSWWEGMDRMRSVLRLQDIFLSPQSFPDLKELEVHQMDVSEPFMVEFLLAHAQTLQVLKMHRMRLNPKGSWPALFASMRGEMDALEVVWLHGQFEEQIGEDGWDMDAPLGRRLERHILGKVGGCPIGEENRCRW